MKKIISGIIMVLLAGFCFGQNTLIVVPLQNQDYVVAETEVDTLTTLLENAIRRTQRFDVVDRGALEDLMREHQFQMSDWSSDRKSVQMGRVLNANYIVRGMVSKLGSSLFVTGRVLDVNTAKILDDAEMQTTMNEAYNKMRNFVKELKTAPKALPRSGFLGMDPLANHIRFFYIFFYYSLLFLPIRRFLFRQPLAGACCVQRLR